MRFWIPILVIAAGSILMGCAPQVDVAAEEEGVRATSARWLEYSDQRDASGVASLFSEDGTVYWEDRPPTSGREAIEAFMSRQFAETPVAGGGFGPDRIDVARSGDLAVEQGTFTGTDTEGRYITVYRKVENDWKVAADMSMSTTPDGGAPAWARESLARWYETFNARDVQSLADLYTADAKVGEARGRAEIIQYFRDGWAEDARTCSGSYDDFVVVGTIAAGRGRDVCVATPTDGGAPTTFYSNWLAMYEQQEDGSWLCIRDYGEAAGS